MTAQDEPKGVACQCGEFTPFTMWVHAHWHLRIAFTCPKCGKGYTVWKGNAKPDISPGINATPRSDPHATR